MEKQIVSNCHKAPIRVARGIFDRDSYWYVCTACDSACDPDNSEMVEEVFNDLK